VSPVLSSIADDWIAAMGNLCGISEAIQDAAAKRSTKKLQAAEAEAAEPDMYVVIKDSHSGSTSDLDINGQDDVALLKRKAAPKVKVGPRMAHKLRLTFASTDMIEGTSCQSYGVCDGAEIVVENAAEVLKGSPVPLCKRLAENQSLNVTPLDYDNLRQIRRFRNTTIQPSYDEEGKVKKQWLTGICFLNDGLMIICTRAFDFDQMFTLVDTKPAEFTMTPIKMPDDKITSPDSICLLGDGVLAISPFQDNTGPLLYDWTSDDWESQPALRRIAEVESPTNYGKMCGICEDEQGRLITTDILNHRVVIFRRDILNHCSNAVFLSEMLVETVVISNLHNPCGVAVLPDGSFGVTEWAKSQVTVFSPDGIPRFCFACPCKNPRAMAVDMNGQICVSDYDGGTVKVFVKIADDFDAAGSEVPVPEPNTCTLKNVEHPMAVAINPDNGHLFVADSENGCIVELTSVQANFATTVSMY